MAWSRAPLNDPLRYIRKIPSGKYMVRIWITELDYQVGFGTFDSLEKTQFIRDRAEKSYNIHDRVKPYRPRKPKRSNQLPICIEVRFSSLVHHDSHGSNTLFRLPVSDS